MKSLNVYSGLVMAIVVGLLSTGCKNPQKPVTPINGAQVGDPKGGKGTPQPFDPGAASQIGQNNAISRPVEDPGALPPHLTSLSDRQQDRDALQPQTVYFEFDRSTVKDAEHAKLDAVADYIKGHAGTDLIIEGHCDERGTEGYNLGLGDKRALACREYLVGKAGVASDRVHTKTLGEAQPAVQGHNEAAWSKNRRAQFVVVLPAK
jgi:peptidoglycan-associated lipoprotein